MTETGPGLDLGGRMGEQGVSGGRMGDDVGNTVERKFDASFDWDTFFDQDHAFGLDHEIWVLAAYCV